METTTLSRGGSGAMFDAIARRYDLLNRLISFGIDKRWRRKTVRALEIGVGEPAAVLDLATGTGDLALEVAERHPKATVIGVDPSEGMLAIGRDKVAAAGFAERVELVAGDAQALTLEDASIDAITMGFGIRNVPDRDQALREMARVLRPGGRVAILELAEPRGFFAPVARLHVHGVVPWLGSLLSGAREYRYLSKSIEAFPEPSAFAQQMEAAGLAVSKIESLTFGACTLYVAARSAES